MSGTELLTSKVRTYMEGLSPNARHMLLKAMRAAEARGELSASQGIMLAAVEGLDFCPISSLDPAPRAPDTQRRHVPGYAVARSSRLSDTNASDTNAIVADPSSKFEAATDIFADSTASATAIASPDWRKRMEAAFFAPVQPLLFDGGMAKHQVGRISRGALAPIWIWIARDLAPRIVEEALANAPAEVDPDPTFAVRALRRRITAILLETLRAAEADPKSAQRLAAQFGGDAISRDLRDIVYVFQREPAFDNFVGQLPRIVTSFDLAEPSTLVDLVRATIENAQVDASFVGAFVLARTGNPVLLLTLAARAAATNDPRALAGSRHGALVDIVLSEVERLASIIQSQLADRTERHKALAGLRDFHELVRHISLTIQIEIVPRWFKRLGAARKALSEHVAQAIEAAPGLVRRALRVEALAGSFGGQFDATTFEDAHFAVTLHNEARLASDSLALHECVGRTRRSLEQTLEAVTSKLLVDLRNNAALDRRSLIEAIDGGVQLSALIFGEDYAALLRKSRDTSQQKVSTR